MSPEDLTPSVVLKWLRIQAQKYVETAKRYNDTASKFNEAADVLESTVEPSQRSAQIPAPHSGAFNARVGSM